MKKLLIFGLLVLSLPTLFSQQTITPDLYRRINYNVLKLIEDYETACTFSRFNSDREFISLFTENAIVYNDYLPSNDKQNVTAQEYFEITQKEKTKSKEIGVEISQVNFVDAIVSKYTNIWTQKIKLKKKIYFWNWNNVRYPDRKIELEFVININTTNENKIVCKIEQITCETPINIFSIANINQKNINTNDGQIRINDEPLELDPNTTVTTLFIPNTTNLKQAFSIDSYDVFLDVQPDTAAKPDKNVYYVKLRDYYNIWGMNIKYNIGSNYKLQTITTLQSDMLKNIDAKSYGYSIGLDYDRKIAKIGNSKYYLHVGLGYEVSGITFTGSYKTEHSAVDIDNDTYIRQIELNGLTEKVKLQTIYLPMGINYKYLLSKRFSLDAAAGLKLYYLFSQNSNLQAKASYKGLYQKYDNVILDRYYDYGYFDLSMPAKLDKLSSFNIGLYASIGGNFRLNKRYSLSLQFGYDYAFYNIAKTKDNYVLSENNLDYNSIINTYQSIVKNYLNIELGIKYNF